MALRSVVKREDIDEALRLMSVSRSSVDMVAKARRAALSQAAKHRHADPQVRLYELIVDLYRARTTSSRLTQSTTTTNNTTDNIILDGSLESTGLPMELIRERVHAQGFTDEQLRQCLVDFDEANVWTISADGTSLNIFN